MMVADGCKKRGSEEKRERGDLGRGR